VSILLAYPAIGLLVTTVARFMPPREPLHVTSWALGIALWPFCLLGAVAMHSKKWKL
jgi:hypothetical protein